MKKYIYLASFLALFSSCTDFLDVAPSKTSKIEIKTVEHLDALLGNHSTFLKEAHKPSSFGTDDCGISWEFYKEEAAAFQSLNNIFHAHWDVPGVMYDTFDQYWENEYKKIFYANLVLSNLPKVTGDQALKDRLKREAHFIRAYSYFELANTYCMLNTPENQNEPGLVLKRSTNFEENIERSTIAETYKLIEEDLAIALEDETPIHNNHKFRPWRISKPGVRAFAARYYFQNGDYDKALTYATDALNEYSELVDYNTEMEYDTPTNITVNGTTYEILYPITKRFVDSDFLSWKENYFSRTLYNGWSIPSHDLMNLYDKDNDLRYKYFYVEHHSFTKGCKTISHPSYIFGFYDIPSGPSVPDMLLTKAECLIRSGKVQEGMSYVERLRVKRIEANAYAPITVNSKEEALNFVFNERRREMPFTNRWFQARRHNQNNDPTDDIEFTKTFFEFNLSNVFFDKPLVEYKLTKNSRRWAAPIPSTEIVAGNGKIIQNTY